MPEEKNLDTLLTETIAARTYGGGGGSEFKDPQETIESGPITAIKVRSGDEIDAIEVVYGGRPGAMNGGSGGSEEEFTIPDGYAITSIELRSGDRIDQLRFIATPMNGEGDPVVSSLFGEGGGEAHILNAPNGLPLRSIEGRSGSRVDQLTFNFGYLYRIENVRVDTEQLKQQLGNLTISVLDTMTYTNQNDADVTVTFENTVTRTVTTTTNWESASRFLAGIEMKVGASVGVVTAETTAKFEFEQTFTFGQSVEESTTVGRSWSIPFVAMGNSVTTAYVSIYEAKVSNVPFTYDVVLYEIEDQVRKEKARVHKTATFSGTVLANEVNAGVESKPLSGGEIEAIKVALLAE